MSTRRREFWAARIAEEEQSIPAPPPAKKATKAPAKKPVSKKAKAKTAKKTE